MSNKKYRKLLTAGSVAVLLASAVVSLLTMQKVSAANDSNEVSHQNLARKGEFASNVVLNTKNGQTEFPDGNGGQCFPDTLSSGTYEGSMIFNLATPGEVNLENFKLYNQNDYSSGNPYVSYKVTRITKIDDKSYYIDFEITISDEIGHHDPALNVVMGIWYDNHKVGAADTHGNNFTINVNDVGTTTPPVVFDPPVDPPVDPNKDKGLIVVRYAIKYDNSPLVYIDAKFGIGITGEKMSFPKYTSLLDQTRYEFSEIQLINTEEFETNESPAETGADTAVTYTAGYQNQVKKGYLIIYTPKDPMPWIPLEPSDPTDPVDPPIDPEIPWTPIEPGKPTDPEKPLIPLVPTKPSTDKDNNKDKDKNKEKLPQTGEAKSELGTVGAMLVFVATLGLVALFDKKRSTR